MSQFVFDAIGTHWVIDISDDLTADQEKTLLAKITERISVFDQAYSRFREDSLVTKMSQTAGRYTLTDDAKEMLDVYRKMYDVTDGLFTALIGETLADAGYDANYSLEQKRPLRSPPNWDEAMSFDAPYLEIKKPVLLDFGAAGKGYLIDLVGKVLQENSIRSFCVDAGGDMLYKNTSGKYLTVGLEHPNDTSKVIGTISILNQSIAGSAGNRRAWGNFHHVINPKTLSSPRHVSAVWVLADTAIIADAIATGLFFVSPERLKTVYTFDYLILNADYSFEKSEGFQAEIFS